MTRRPGVRRTVVAAGITAVSASAACAREVAGVEVAPNTPTSGRTPQPAATIDANAGALLRAAAALDKCLTLDASVAPAARTGVGLPGLALSCLGDDPVIDLSSLRGPHVINIWASACAECREAPYLAEVYAAPARTVGFLGVDYLAEAVVGLRAAKGLGMGYPSVWSDDDSLRAPLGLVGLPLTLLGDVDGRIVARTTKEAFASVDDLRAFVKAHLGAT